MNPRHFVIAPLLLPAISPTEASAESLAQRYDTSYQSYQEDNGRMHITSYYLRGVIDINADTTFRFQYLRDAISGSTPTGVLPGQVDLPFLAEIDDVRTGFLGAIAHQFGDHRLELEAVMSDEHDYNSTGLSLSDAWELNQKNTTIAFGINYINDLVQVRGTNPQDKTGLDLFTGVTQIIDKNTVVSANFTLGTSNGYLNDPYKTIQRSEIYTYDDGYGGIVNVPYVTNYAENRPDQRIREVLQLQGTHYFEPVNGALDAIVRLSNDDYGVFSQCVQLEWRQAIGEKFEVTPYLRYYWQNAADFFMNTLDGVPISNPPNYPDGSGPNYSSDYRLSALETSCIGLRMRYQFCEAFSSSISYERYEMKGRGSDAAPAAAYPSANIWTIGIGAKF